jgi:antitoxin component of MazEF toxin-antitoxin module
MPITVHSKIGSHNEIIIPRDIMNSVGLRANDEVELSTIEMKLVIVPRRSAVDAISGALAMKRELVDELIENEDLYEPEEF